MKKSLLISTFLLAISASALAQKRPAAPATITLEQAMSQYRFDEAERIMNQDIAATRKRRADVTEKEAMLRQIQRAKSRLHATERTTFIDSIVTSKADAINHIFLSDESGKVLTYNEYFHKKDSTQSTVYLSQFADKIVFAQPDANGEMMLYSSNLVGNEWTAPELLAEQGLGEHGDIVQNYPFMLNDGTTLYYAAKGEESIGGYDIFMTRYDADEHHFLAPENIGMPFNSPANDYLFAIDEYHNLGYFVTDRNMPSDTVCVYTFIPNASRRIYNQEEIGDARLQAFARISSIADTWENKEAVQASLATLKGLKNNQSATNKNGKDAFELILNDRIIYTSLSQIQNPELLKKVQYWLESKNDLKKAEDNLQLLRDKYASSNADARTAMTQQIAQEENRVRTLYLSIDKQLKEMRQAVQ